MPDTAVRKIYFGERIEGRPLNTLALVLLSPDDSWCREIWRYMNAFDRLCELAPRCWRVTDLDQADVIVYPHWFNPLPGEGERVAAVARMAREAGLPCLFFQQNDLPPPPLPDYGHVFRTSLFADRRSENEFARAAETDDMLADLEGRVRVRPKDKVPTVGFCGNVSNLWREIALQVLGKSANVEGTRFRRRVIQRLQRSRLVQSDFIFRKRFWGGAVTRRRRDERLQRRLRRQYMENMLRNNYTLCVRGAGNFSYRFYETLSIGRVPLFINTRCVLPFDDRVDWSKHCVMVDEQDAQRADEVLVAFHESVTTDELETMQRENRRLWEEWLAPMAFYQRAFDQVCAPRPCVREVSGGRDCGGTYGAMERNR